MDLDGNGIQNSCTPRHCGALDYASSAPQCLGLQRSHNVLVGKCRGIGESGDIGLSVSMCEFLEN